MLTQNGRLTTQDYGDRTAWAQVFDADKQAEVMAYAEGSSIDAAGDLSITAMATESITATVVAASAGVSVASTVAVGLSGSGASTENTIDTWVKAYIDGYGDDGIHAGSITIAAHDSPYIKADAVASSLAATSAPVSRPSVSTRARPSSVAARSHP